MYKNLDNLFENLSNSKFRNSFHLNKKMKDYVNEKGLDVIKTHAYDFINKRLKPEYIMNDGKQTPMRQTHPVFIAQHATATCCRGCLSKWHKIPKGRELTDRETSYIVNVIMEFIKRDIASNNKKTTKTDKQTVKLCQNSKKLPFVMVQ